jgi:hypothetical protein
MAETNARIDEAISAYTAAQYFKIDRNIFATTRRVGQRDGSTGKGIRSQGV